MKKLLSCIILLFALQLACVENAVSAPTAKNAAYFVLKVYHFKDARQEASIDSFIQYKYVPFLHSSKLNNVGVFKAIANDTAADKKIYVLIPFKSLKAWESFSSNSVEPTITGDAGYVNAAYNKPAYTRFETILLKAFPTMEAIAPSKLSSPKSERVYELRSYEGATEKLFRNKVKMFNEGGEIALFSRLGFNAVFYSEVVFGAKMPNLMYMTSFENQKSRDEHWKAFSADPEWKVLAAKPEYQRNVSHIDITFLRPTEYSDL
ncbi:NIPSNAP family protein [Segetibacter sp.]|jgi:hypothetical protein|uniref:NIPSNAP family protein n=1 Tax=Segetibacter sp. TaxID=2231182 RepID=UPI002623A769|nr:NIPSNAP family protein [Segetibacter sp.]MCW3082091.1 family containing protein [Segetibacter sp.]